MSIDGVDFHCKTFVSSAGGEGGGGEGERGEGEGGGRRGGR